MRHFADLHASKDYAFGHSFQTLWQICLHGRRWHLVLRQRSLNLLLLKSAVNASSCGDVPCYIMGAMSALGTKQTLISTMNMSAFGGKADFLIYAVVSATDPKRTVDLAAAYEAPTAKYV